MGPDNIYYTSSKRFQSFQAGVGIPLFFGSQKAKINVLKIHQQIADNNLVSNTALFQLNFKKAYQAYLTSVDMVDYYENKGIKNAEETINAATEQYRNGNINYLEWVVLTNQAVNIKVEYMNAVSKLNNSIIELNYLTNK
jgi:cobalt-zinc-cadmium resistance protein CzcA